MNSIVLLDTSVYLNVLDIPDANQDRKEVLSEFKRRIKENDKFLLPFATILECGNHISRMPNGQMRRKFAFALVQDVDAAIKGDSPYQPTAFPVREDFLLWLKTFPEHAMRTKRMKKDKEEGGSLSDLTIIKEWEKTCKRHPLSRVLIWSLDEDLKSYDRQI